MLPFYSLLEHPHRACADPSRPTFAPARRVSLHRTNQHIQHTQSRHDQQQAFQLTCGTQTEGEQRAAARAESQRRGRQCEEKEQLDSLDQLLAYPAVPRTHSEEDIRSAENTASQLTP